MKKIAAILAGAVLLMAAGIAWATPITFTPNVSGSSVSVTDYASYGDLNANLVLSGSSFSLDDNSIQTLDFFTLTATGLALNRNYNISATLAFSAPPVTGSGTGNGKFTTIFGLLSAGTLTWDATTLPDYFTLQDGNKISIDFENGRTIGLGNTATVHAYVQNYGGAAPVPEPASIVLLGAGLLGFGLYSRRRIQR